MPHRPWSTVLLVVHAFGVAAGVVAVGCGVVLFAVAASAPPPEPADGINEPWGLFIGGFLAVVGIVVGVPAGVLTKLTVAGRRAADQGRPGVLHGLAITVVALAGIGAVGSLAGGFTFLFLVGLVLCGIYALPGVLILRATRATSRARADSNARTSQSAPHA